MLQSTLDFGRIEVCFIRADFCREGGHDPSHVYGAAGMTQLPLHQKRILPVLLVFFSFFLCFGAAIYIRFHVVISHLILTLQRKPAPVSPDLL